MKRDARLRDVLVRALIVEPDRKTAGEILDEWDAMVEQVHNARPLIDQWIEKAKILRDELVECRHLLSEHHAAGVMDGVLIGDQCPVCKKEKSGHVSGSRGSP